MFSEKGPLHRLRIFAALISCSTVVSAQSNPGFVPPAVSTSCSLIDPGPRPAGNTIVYTVADNHGNTFDNFAQQDQTGASNSSGSPLPSFLQGSTLDNERLAFWEAGMGIFGEVASVNGAAPGVTSTQPITGLGPRFNGNSCFMCHSQPSFGGTSPGPGTPPSFTQNPQIGLAGFDGATNAVPSFVSGRPNGPVVEARFPRNADSVGNPLNTLDGAVHDLYTIQGMPQAGPCSISQPLFNAAVANNNIILRIPTPTFGVGFVETTSDDALVANLNSAINDPTSLNVTSALGVAGRFNRVGNDQTVTRFGWKAQNVSLLMFAGEASNVEMGVTNELFPFERDSPENDGTNCTGNATPEDFTAPLPTITQQIPKVTASDIEALSFFMFGNTAPAQCDFGSGVTQTSPGVFAPNCNALSTAAKDGATQFNRAGCNLCHTGTLHTGPSNFVDLNNAAFSPFSDFAIHHMGAQLADGVNQGAAGPDEFRTAPLWGAGQRLFFMHDGRSTNLVDAIEQHFTPTTLCTTVTTQAETFTLNGQTITIPAQTTKTCGSEANGVVNRFNNQSILTCTQQQHLIDFLRSL
jgi:CxxC motif-containing protein (DUF1111 family)